MCLLQAPRTVEAVIPAETSRIVGEYAAEIEKQNESTLRDIRLATVVVLPLYLLPVSSQPRTSCSFFSSRCVNVCSQPGLRMSFGFSVGDLVSAIGIEVRNANVIRQSQLERKCQQLDQELHQLALPLVGLSEACKLTDLE